MRIDTLALIAGALPLLLCFAASSDAGSKGKESGAAPAPTPAVSDVRQPVRKKLGIQVLGKVGSVYWTASRDETYFSTLQILFPTVRQGEKQPEHPKTQVWLLKADGTVIPPSQQPTIMGTDNAGGTTESAFYNYSHSAAGEAIAVVVCIDSQLFVEALARDAK